MYVPAARMVFINAHDPFVEGIGTRYRHGTAET
jgi:hypothetical protein